MNLQKDFQLDSNVWTFVFSIHVIQAISEKNIYFTVSEILLYKSETKKSKRASSERLDKFTTPNPLFLSSLYTGLAGF